MCLDVKMSTKPKSKSKLVQSVRCKYYAVKTTGKMYVRNARYIFSNRFGCIPGIRLNMNLICTENRQPALCLAWQEQLPTFRSTRLFNTQRITYFSIADGRVMFYTAFMHIHRAQTTPKSCWTRPDYVKKEGLYIGRWSSWNVWKTKTNCHVLISWG